jgi:DNA-binding response OmpR family regulator
MSPLILVIEDEAPVRTFLRAALADAKLRVIEAANAADGMRLAAEQSPALLLLDLGLPDLNGVEVIKRVRQSSTVPIVVLSARGQERDKLAAFELGADDYVAKPVSAGELIARIRVALRHANQAGNPPSPGSLHIPCWRATDHVDHARVRPAGAIGTQLRSAPDRSVSGRRGLGSARLGPIEADAIDHRIAAPQARSHRCRAPSRSSC